MYTGYLDAFGSRCFLLAVRPVTLAGAKKSRSIKTQG